MKKYEMKTDIKYFAVVCKWTVITVSALMCVYMAFALMFINNGRWEM